MSTPEPNVPPMNATGFPPASPGGAPQPGYGTQPPYVAQPNYEAPKPKKKFRLIGLLVSLLIIGGGAAWGLWQSFQRDQLLAVGNCVVAEGTENDPKIEEAKCDDTTKTTFKVASVKKDGSECGDGYLEYQVKNKAKLVAAYCLVPNLLENKCYTDSSGVSGYSAVECSDPSAKVKVAKRFEGTSTAQCPADTESYALPSGTTFCLAPPN